MILFLSNDSVIRIFCFANLALECRLFADSDLDDSWNELLFNIIPLGFIMTICHQIGTFNSLLDIWWIGYWLYFQIQQSMPVRNFSYFHDCIWPTPLCLVTALFGECNLESMSSEEEHSQYVEEATVRKIRSCNCNIDIDIMKRFRCYY